MANLQKDGSFWANQVGGFLIEFLIMSFALSIMTLLALQFVQSAYRQQAHTERKLAVRALGFTIEGQLKNDTFCRCNLKGVDFNGSDVSVSQLRSYPYTTSSTCPTGSKWLAVNDPVPTRRDVILSQINFINVEPFSGDRFRADLELKFDTTAAKGIALPSMKVGKFVVSTNGSGTVEDCRSAQYAMLGNSLTERNYEHADISNGSLRTTSQAYSITSYPTAKALRIEAFCDVYGLYSVAWVEVDFFRNGYMLYSTVGCIVQGARSSNRTSVIYPSVIPLPVGATAIRIKTQIFDPYSTGQIQRAQARLVLME